MSGPLTGWLSSTWLLLHDHHDLEDALPVIQTEGDLGVVWIQVPLLEQECDEGREVGRDDWPHDFLFLPLDLGLEGQFLIGEEVYHVLVPVCEGSLQIRLELLVAKPDTQTAADLEELGV